MGLSNVKLLLVVIFLHFLSAGLVAPVFSLHIMMSGGNHVILGSVPAWNFILQAISKDFIALFEHGKKYALTLCLFMSFLCYFGLVFYYTVWIIVTIKCVYALFNRVHIYAKEFVTKTEPEDTHTKIFNMIDIMRVAGMVVGPITGGYLFECNRDFASIAMMSAALNIMGVLLLQHIDTDDVNTPKPESHLKSIPRNCYTRLKDLKEVEYREHWDTILLKSTYVFTFIVYFSRFAFLLCFNYQVGSVIVGYSVAYENIWIFISTCLVPFVKGRTNNKKALFEHSLLVCGFALPGLYYAPTYECHLFIFIAVAFSYTLVNSLLEDDVLDLKKQNDVYEATKTIKNVVHIVAPICFGFVCQFLGGYAFKVLSLLPLVVCIYLVNQRVLRRVHEESQEGIKED